jgi:hypothetical protein
MIELNKAHIGLGKVRNKITPSIEEFTSLETKINKLIQDGTIQGTLSTLHDENSNVSYDNTNFEYSVNLTSVKVVKILMDVDEKILDLSGGEEGLPIFVEISNPASFNLSWKNLRAPYGDNPGLSITTNGGEASKTILEIVKLGNFYYMIGIYRDEPEYTLQDLVLELNNTFDSTLTRITGEIGVLTERFTVQDLGLDTIGLETITIFDNSEYLQSGYTFILDIPETIMDIFHPNFIVPIIDKLETDTTKYYINKI